MDDDINQQLLDAVAASPGVAEALRGVRDGNFPLFLQGPAGALPAFLLSLIARQGAPENDGGLSRMLIVAATERDAEALCADMQSLGVETALFPWWGAIPYRDMAPLSAVFGERAKVLAACSRGSRLNIIITSERAFLSPVPPPDYIRSLLTTLRPGDTLDTTALAEKLAEWGYTRVPRVQLPGEFALRGEVFDIYLGGDSAESGAFRVLFDFDTVESIRPFKVETQSGGEKIPALTLRPLKEVVWTDERIETLQRNLASFEEYELHENGSGSINDVMESLITRRTVSGV
jgi:transcription-repair coupling factor (superfamily II helicase)